MTKRKKLDTHRREAPPPPTIIDKVVSDEVVITTNEGFVDVTIEEEANRCEGFTEIHVEGEMTEDDVGTYMEILVETITEERDEDDETNMEIPIETITWEGDDDAIEEYRVDLDDVEALFREYASVEKGGDLDRDIVAVEDVDELGTEAQEDSDEDVGDYIWNDDVLPDPLDSDDDEEVYERKQERANKEESDELLYLGKTFGSSADFKIAVLRYYLKTGKDIKLYKSTAKQIGAKCTNIDCPWRIYCSYERCKRKMLVKIYENNHKCLPSGYSKMLKTSTIAYLFAERLRLNPKLTKQEMADEIKREWNLEVTPIQCGKAKAKLYRERKASHEAHFSRVWDYQAEIRKSNRGSTILIETIPVPNYQVKQRFDRLYMCFKAQRQSWLKTCRPIIGLDGAFLKWDIKGHLLAAVGRDGDNRIVPIAWAVVEIENNNSWDWFVKCLKDDLKLGNGRDFTIISDKQKGLLKVVHSELPKAEHRMCARHILANWKREGDNKLELQFWKIAKSYTKGDYEQHMEELKQYSRGAYESLLLSKPETWSRAFFRVGSFCNDVTNNLSESFNRTIKETRKKPLLEMLELIRRQCMVRNTKRLAEATRLSTRFTKRATKEINLSIAKSSECKRFAATGDLHEVDETGCSYRVDMGMRTCGCVKWQLTGIPCIHAACVIIKTKQKVGDYVSHYYTKVTWKKTYINGIEPVEGMKLWPRTNGIGVLPPPYRLGKRGRPSNYDRRKSAGETFTKLAPQKRVMTCSNCQQEGHSKSYCKNPSVEPPIKRPRGRPRLEGEPHGSFGQSTWMCL